MFSRGGPRRTQASAHNWLNSTHNLTLNRLRRTDNEWLVASDRASAPLTSQYLANDTTYNLFLNIKPQWNLNVIICVKYLTMHWQVSRPVTCRPVPSRAVPCRPVPSRAVPSYVRACSIDLLLYINQWWADIIKYRLLLHYLIHYRLLVDKHRWLYS